MSKKNLTSFEIESTLPPLNMSKSKKKFFFKVFKFLAKMCHLEKNRLVMEFFRKGGGVLDPIHNLEAHFLCLKS